MGPTGAAMGVLGPPATLKTHQGFAKNESLIAQSHQKSNPWLLWDPFGLLWVCYGARGLLLCRPGAHKDCRGAQWGCYGAAVGSISAALGPTGAALRPTGAAVGLLWGPLGLLWAS